MPEKPISLNDFISNKPSFFQNLYQGMVTSEDLDTLTRNLKTAVDSGIYYYMYDKQTELSAKMELQRKQYAEHLKQWLERSEQQIAIDYDDTPTTIQQKNKQNKFNEIQTIADKKSSFYRDLTTLDNTNPYIKVLAVLYNF